MEDGGVVDVEDDKVKRQNLIMEDGGVVDVEDDKVKRGGNSRLIPKSWTPQTNIRLSATGSLDLYTEKQLARRVPVPQNLIMEDGGVVDVEDDKVKRQNLIMEDGGVVDVEDDKVKRGGNTGLIMEDGGVVEVET